VTTGDRYRAKALELLARADGEIDPEMRAESENLAAAFCGLLSKRSATPRWLSSLSCHPNRKAIQN